MSKLKLFMNIQAEKLKLLKLLLETENPKILDSIRNIFTQSKEDFWCELSEDQQIEIEKGINEILNGESVEYESFMKKHRK